MYVYSVNKFNQSILTANTVWLAQFVRTYSIWLAQFVKGLPAYNTHYLANKKPWHSVRYTE